MTLGDRIVVLSRGEIQQQGTPEELFITPRNRFVAGFIGSPPMNFLEGMIEDGAGGIAVRIGDTRFTLPERAASALQTATSPKVILGVRPSAISRPAAGANGATRLSAAVRVSEYVGAQSVLHVDTAVGPLTAELPADHRIRVGETIDIGLPPDGLYIFDGETEIRLLGGEVLTPDIVSKQPTGNGELAEEKQDA